MSNFYNNGKNISLKTLYVFVDMNILRLFIYCASIFLSIGKYAPYFSNKHFFQTMKVMYVRMKHRVVRPIKFLSVSSASFWVSEKICGRDNPPRYLLLKLFSYKV